jgi:hypothetical protein
MRKKTKNKRPKSKIIHSLLHGKNLDTMKLLISWNKFRVDVLQLRKDFSIPLEGFSNSEELKKWDEKLCQNSDDFWETKYYKNRIKKLLLLRKKDHRQFLIEQENINKEVPINKFNQSIKDLLKKYSLPYNFLDTIRMYIYHNKIMPVFLPDTNFSLSLDPEGRKGTARWIEIRTYARLTEKEIRDAMSSLRELQKHYLPFMLTKDIRKHQDIDRAINIEREMEQRRRKTYQTPDWYLQQVRKAYGEKEFERVKKLDPTRIEKEIIKYTSKEIAKKILGSAKRGNLVRQIYSRLQKEREKRFGKIT